MRKILIIAVALFGLIGVSAVASADHDADLNRAWFFGDCESYEDSTPAVNGAGLLRGCHGFGIFWGHFDAESLAYAIEAEAWDEIYAEVVVVKLYAFKVGGGGTQFVLPIVGVGGDYGACGDEWLTSEVETQDIEGPDITGGLWIAWFEVEICDIYME